MAIPRRVISGRRLTGYEPWELPVVGAAAEGAQPAPDVEPDPSPGPAEATLEPEPAPHPPTAAEIEEIQRQARAEGFEAGRRAGEERGRLEGLERGQEEAAGLVDRLKEVLDRLAHPLEGLDERVEQSLVSLAMSVSRHLLRRELKMDPGQVIAVVREAMAALPVAANRVQIYLHPGDAALVKERLTIKDDESPWEILEDPGLSRGGCRVVSETSLIDATVENRVAAAVAHIMGDERDASDRT